MPIWHYDLRAKTAFPQKKHHFRCYKKKGQFEKKLFCCFSGLGVKLIKFNFKLFFNIV